MKRPPKVYDCAVIGGGPGGLLSALYLCRYHRSVVIFRSGKPRASWIPKIHHLLGVTGTVSGRQMLRRLEVSLKKHGARFVETEAKVEREGDGFAILGDQKIVRARKVILATGVEDVHPPFDGLEKLCEKGVIGYCPICDGYEHYRQPIGLLVKDNHGLSKMEFLYHYSNDLKVILLKKFEIAPRHAHFIKQKKIKVYRSGIETVKLNRSGNGAIFSFRRGKELRVRVAYVGLGVRIRDEAFAHLKSLKKTKAGFILVNSVQETSVPGLYAVGDCVNDLFQVSVAAGHAAIAATEVHNQLDFD